MSLPGSKNTLEELELLQRGDSHRVSGGKTLHLKLYLIAYHKIKGFLFKLYVKNYHVVWHFLFIDIFHHEGHHLLSFVILSLYDWLLVYLTSFKKKI